MPGDHPTGARPARLGRRTFLGSAALGSAALGAAALAGCTSDEASGQGPGRRVPFLGDHQPGIDTPAAHFGLLAAFNLVSEDRARLARSLRDLTDEARALMEARPPERRDTAYPPAETGMLGPGGRTDGLPSPSASGRRCSTTASGWPAASPRSWSGCRSCPTTNWRCHRRSRTCPSPAVREASATAGVGAERDVQAASSANRARFLKSTVGWP